MTSKPLCLVIEVRGENGRGLSTIAALVAFVLKEHGIPVEVKDGEASATNMNAERLLEPGNWPRLFRNAASIAAREKLVGANVAICTKQVTHPPTFTPKEKL